MPDPRAQTSDAASASTPAARPAHHAASMTPQAWTLFAAMSVIWGMPYFLIAVGVQELDPAALVLARTALASLVLLPIAILGGSLRPALRRWPLVALFAAMEIGVPWLLLSHAEERIGSGLAGLTIATVPLVGAIVMRLLGDRHSLSGTRLAGMVTGIVGVVALVGLNALGGHMDALSVVELLIVAIGYATAPILLDRRLGDVPAVGVITVSLVLVTIAYLPVGTPALLDAAPLLPATWAALLSLGLVCTALAFVLFFRLIAVAGPVRATVITFVNPAVAILLGVTILHEPLTVGIAVGFPLVLVGSWLATRPTTSGAHQEHSAG